MYQDGRVCRKCLVRFAYASIFIFFLLKGHKNRIRFRNSINSCRVRISRNKSNNGITKPKSLSKVCCDVCACSNYHMFCLKMPTNRLRFRHSINVFNSWHGRIIQNNSIDGVTTRTSWTFSIIFVHAPKNAIKLRFWNSISSVDSYNVRIRRAFKPDGFRLAILHFTPTHHTQTKKANILTPPA